MSLPLVFLRCAGGSFSLARRRCTRVTKGRNTKCLQVNLYLARRSGQMMTVTIIVIEFSVLFKNLRERKKKKKGSPLLKRNEMGKKLSRVCDTKDNDVIILDASDTRLHRKLLRSRSSRLLWVLCFLVNTGINVCIKKGISCLKSFPLKHRGRGGKRRTNRIPFYECSVVL